MIWVKLFNWEDLASFEYELHVQISSLHVILREQENLLLRLRKEFEKETNEHPDLKNISGQDKAAMYDWLFAFSGSVLDEFTIYQRQSVIATIFAFLESFLKELCEYIEKRFEGKFSIINHKKNNEALTTYWNFLTVGYEINSNKLEPLFTKLKQGKLIRNIFAHQGGYYAKSEKKQPQIGNGLEVSDLGDKIFIKIPNDTYAKYLLKIITEFTNELVKSVDSKYGEIIK